MLDNRNFFLFIKNQLRLNDKIRVVVMDKTGFFKKNCQTFLIQPELKPN